MGSLAVLLALLFVAASAAPKWTTALSDKTPYAEGVATLIRNSYSLLGGHPSFKSDGTNTLASDYTRWDVYHEEDPATKKEIVHAAVLCRIIPMAKKDTYLIGAAGAEQTDDKVYATALKEWLTIQLQPEKKMWGEVSPPLWFSVAKFAPIINNQETALHFFKKPGAWKTLKANFRGTALQPMVGQCSESFMGRGWNPATPFQGCYQRKLTIGGRSESHEKIMVGCPAGIGLVTQQEPGTNNPFTNKPVLQCVVANKRIKSGEAVTAGEACLDKKIIDETPDLGFKAPVGTKFYKSKKFNQLMSQVLHNKAPGLGGLTFLQVFDILQQEGCEIFPHGGAVRDILFGKLPKDIDVGFNCELSKVKRIAKERGWPTNKASDKFIQLGGVEAGNPFEPLEGTPHKSFVERPGSKKEYTVNDLTYSHFKGVIIDIDGTSVGDACALRIALPVDATNTEQFKAWAEADRGRKVIRAFKLRAKGLTFASPELEAQLVRNLASRMPGLGAAFTRGNIGAFFCGPLLQGRHKRGANCKCDCDDNLQCPGQDRLSQFNAVLKPAFDGVDKSLWAKLILPLQSYKCYSSYKVGVFVGGGFKPPHAGHYANIKTAMVDSWKHYHTERKIANVLVVGYVFITPGPRGVFTQEDSYNTWTIYREGLLRELKKQGINANLIIQGLGAKGRKNKFQAIKKADNTLAKMWLVAGDDRTRGAFGIKLGLIFDISLKDVTVKITPRDEGNTMSATKFRKSLCPPEGDTEAEDPETFIPDDVADKKALIAQLRKKCTAEAVTEDEHDDNCGVEPPRFGWREGAPSPLVRSTAVTWQKTKGGGLKPDSPLLRSVAARRTMDIMALGYGCEPFAEDPIVKVPDSEPDLEVPLPTPPTTTLPTPPLLPPPPPSGE